MLNNNLIHLGIFHELLSVDESMVPYFGRHSAKSLYVGSQYVLAIKSGACVGMKATHIIWRFTTKEKSQLQLHSRNLWEKE